MAEIIISNWQNGIAPSPYEGFSFMQNVESYRVPGVLFPTGAANVAGSSSVVVGTPKWVAQDTDNSATVYILDSLQNIYYGSAVDGYVTWSLLAHSGGSPSTGSGNGLCMARVASTGATMLIVVGDTHIDVNHAGAWTNNWGSLSLVTGDHPIIQGQDNIVYYGNSNNISSISNLASGSPPTASFTPAALSGGLPVIYKITCLEEFGTNLMIGTYAGPATSQLGRLKVADIFPWNRSTVSGFSLPIRLPEVGVNQMKNVNNLLYIQAGNSGNYYVSNGSSTRLLLSIPKSMVLNTVFPSYIVKPAAMMFHKDRIFSGFSSLGNLSVSGVYSFNLDGSGLILENVISKNDLSSNVTVGVIYPTPDSAQSYTYLIGWSNGTDRAIDIVGGGSGVSSYNAFADSQVFAIGTAFQPETLDQLEVYLERPLASGDGVKVQYRTDMSQSFTTALTYDFTTYGASQKINYPWSVTAEEIQFRTAVTGNARLKSVRWTKSNAS